MNILIIGATHGDELLGTKLYERLLNRRLPILEHIDFIVGNPRAYAQKKRYTDNDLNRCYGSDGDSYEHIRASEIARYIAATTPDIVLDMHTTNCHQPPCLIIANLDGARKQQFLRASHVGTLLKVQPMNDVLSLGDNIIGYEVPNHMITAQLLDNIIADVRRFIAGQGGHETKQLFTMQGKIYKNEVTAAQARTFSNFNQHTLGFVPIMTGNNSYKRDTDYLGFKASKSEQIRV